jgi:hypothetical protein
MNSKQTILLLLVSFVLIISLSVVSAHEVANDGNMSVIDDSISEDHDVVAITNDEDNLKSDDGISTVIEVQSTFSRVANDYSAGERGDMFYAVLKDSNGKPLAGKTVQIAVNGPIYNVTTDSQGRAGLQVNLAAANTYTYALSFSGDDQYAPAKLACSKLTVTKKSTSISASAKTFKASAKTKTVSVTLKTSKNPYDQKIYLKAGKTITLKVGGKTYSAKINNKGVAKFNIKLTKKGKYTAKISFAGDKTYKSASKSIKITIK